MKSILQEASSVFKAVEKAWDRSGMPNEFTIKILEIGDKNFFGISKKPAIISITYDPKRQTKSIIVKKDEVVLKNNKPLVYKDKKEKSASRFIQSFLHKAADEFKNINKKTKHDYNLSENDLSKKESLEGWNKEFIKEISVWLKEILQIMGIDSTFDIKVEQKILKIYIQKKILKELEEEKMFFISLSHILMQFLKRKYKKRLINYYLIFYTQEFDISGNKKDNIFNK